MRWSWLVLLAVVGGGVFAFLRGTEAGSREKAEALAATAAGKAADVPQLALTPEAQRLEEAAAAVVAALDEATAKGDGERAKLLGEQLRNEHWDTFVARRLALRRGQEMAAQIPTRRTNEEARILHLDRMRRFLSRGVFLPELFQKNGASTEARTQLLRTIQDANREVMTWPKGVAGVTRPYVVEAGLAPVQIVHRERVPAGVNAILFWNHGGNLDPRRLRADETLLLPLEPLSLEVVQDVHRLGIFLGGCFVKEFVIGVGRENTPTPVGVFRLIEKQTNPPWTTTIDGRTLVIPPGDPRNELGSVWMAIASNEWPKDAGYGIHGTVKPETVGTHCSNGCVRLRNQEAEEVFDWVRRAGNDVPATEIHIRHQ